MATRKKVQKDDVAATNESKATVQKPARKSESDKIWDKIANCPIDVFALDNQRVHQYVTRFDDLDKAEPEYLHLLLKSGAVLPALEETLRKVPLPKGKVFEVSPAANFVVVKIVSKLY